MPRFVHKPVMVAEVLAALQPRPGGFYADGTIGGAGHAAAILRASSPTGRLFGCDCDGIALEAARERLAEFAGRVELRHGRFGELADWLAANSCDGVLLDLGVSSPQLETAERGFSFQLDGPLDMRMDPRQEWTAADLVNTASVADLARLFEELGGERDALQLARAIERERQVRRFTTTRQLAGWLERVRPRQGQRVHPATRVFLALRMAVNDELGVLSRGLEAALTILKPGGRLAVITFHSAEARVVKQFGRKWARPYDVEGGADVPELRRPRPPRLRWVNRKAIEPAAAEVAENPRSRSAQLRVFEKL